MILGDNVVVLRGNLASDPELTGNSNSIAKFRLAVSNAGNDSKNKDNKTGFFDVICFLDTAQSGDFVRRMIKEDKLSKGSGVSIVGTLNHSRWEAKDGGNRSRVELIMEGFSYAGTRSGSDSKGDGADRPAKTSGSDGGGGGSQDFRDF